MPGLLFHVGATAMCPHAGQVQVISSNTRVMVNGDAGGNHGGYIRCGRLPFYGAARQAPALHQSPMAGAGHSGHDQWPASHLTNEHRAVPKPGTDSTRAAADSGHTNEGNRNMIYIDHPFHFDGRGRTALTDEADHVYDMIEQFLFTNPGERVNRPDFGSGLLNLMFEPNSVELAATLQMTIQAGLQQWLGDVIEVRNLTIETEDSTLRVSLQYLIKRTGDVRAGVFERRI